MERSRALQGVAFNPQPRLRILSSMVRAVKQHVTVAPDGSIAIRSPDLPPGACAEVIVLLESADSTEAAPPDPAARLVAFKELQRQLNLTPEKAEAWLKEIREEREAWGDRMAAVAVPS